MVEVGVCVVDAEGFVVHFNPKPSILNPQLYNPDPKPDNLNPKLLLPSLLLSILEMRDPKVCTPYSGTSPIRKIPPPKDPPRTLDIGLR